MDTTEISNSVQELVDYFVDIISDDNGDKPSRLSKLFEDYKDYLKAGVSDPLRGPRDEDDDLKVSASLKAMVQAMQLATPGLSEADAAHHLLHSAHGRALAIHLNSLTKKETPMQTDIFKLHNIESVVTIAKHIIDNGASEISEFDFYRVVNGHAQMNKRVGESDAKAFNRVFATPEIRRAYGIVKGYMDIEPVSVEVSGSVTADDSKKAYEQLYKMAEEMRRKSPTLTIHQAFARVFTAEENRQWASAATRGR
jgi:hypothetical protein